MILLGKKTFGWKVKFCLLSPLWALSTSSTRKSWSEFKYGLIDHKCEHDYNDPKWETHNNLKGKHYSCKHHGCNIVSVQELNGDWCEVIDLNKV